jgi:hypothetical protein
MVLRFLDVELVKHAISFSTKPENLQVDDQHPQWEVDG